MGGLNSLKNLCVKMTLTTKREPIQFSILHSESNILRWEKNMSGII